VLKYHFPKAISYEDITKTDFSIHRGSIDILSGGFPCQPYSSAGRRLGKEDERHLWPQMLRAVKEIQPRWVLGENVLGITNWNGGLVFEEIQVDLENQGYKVQAYVLPAVSVNAPHVRQRVFFIAYSELNTKGQNIGRYTEQKGDLRRGEESNVFGTFCGIGNATDTECSGLEYRSETRNLRSEKAETRGEGSKSTNEFETNGNATNTRSKGLQGWQINRDFAEKKGKGEHDRNSSRQIPFGWENFPTVAPICVRDDGFSNRLDRITFPKWRKESIKAAGNAVVPQLVLQLFKTIAEYERITNSEKDNGSSD
jgi:DNA (cytosine-5)-methyltransferase 1